MATYKLDHTHNNNTPSSLLVEREKTVAQILDDIKIARNSTRLENERRFKKARAFHRWRTLGHVFPIAGSIFIIINRVFFTGFTAVDTLRWDILIPAILLAFTLVFAFLAIVNRLNRRTWSFASRISLYATAFLVSTLALMNVNAHIQFVLTLAFFLYCFIYELYCHRGRKKGYTSAMFLKTLMLLIVALGAVVCYILSVFYTSTHHDSDGDTIIVYNEPNSASVLYTENEDGVCLSRVLLTAGDLIGSDKRDTYTVKEVIKQRTITEIGADAMNGVKGYSQMSLPASVKKVGTRAFANTDVTSLRVSSPSIMFVDGLQHSSITDVYFTSDACTITTGDYREMKEDLVFHVPAYALDTYIEMNPQYKDYFVTD